MNNSFSLKRTGQLIAKQWAEHRRLYLMSALALLGMLGVTFTIWVINGGKNYQEDITYVFGLIGLFITGTIFASTTFSMLHTKDKGIYWITFPAGHFEKFLVGLFFNVVVFSLVYFVCFHVLKFFAESYIHLLMNGKDGYLYSYSKVDWLNKRGIAEIVPAFINVFFVAQAAFILGSATFKRFSFIITAIIVTAVFFLTIVYLTKLSQGMLPKHYDFELMTVKSDIGQGQYKSYEMPWLLKNALIVFFRYLLAPFLWLVTWFKLKEKEI